jgi:hypothetical protein
MADNLLSFYVDRLIGLARESGVVGVREGAARGLSRIAVDTKLDEVILSRVADTLTGLANDTSARVRQTIQTSLAK